MTTKLDSMGDGLQERITPGLEKCAVVLPSAERKNERSDWGFIAGSPKPVCRLSFRGARNGFNLPGKSGCHVVQNNSTYEDVILFREITS